MARKKKARLTLKKKLTTSKKAKKAVPEGLLSEAEFAALSHDYGSFIVEDSEHEPHTFAIGEAVYLLHGDSKDSGDDAKDNHWIGKIIDIRGDSPDNVWMRVQWYWSPQEVAEVIKSFDPAICGKFEKLSSDNYDIISVHSVVDRVEVKNFDETGIYQEPIGDEEWFCRYHFLYEARRISLKVTRLACTICKTPYTPGAEKILHFCPRPSCCVFYHQACLVRNGYVEEARSHRLLETWPDIDRTASVEELARSYHPRKKQKKDHSGSNRSQEGPLAAFPEELVAIAEQQIIRGTVEGGVVGNITSVAAARQLIYNVLIGAGGTPDKWDSRIDTSATHLNPDTLPNCICPSCYSPI